MNSICFDGSKEGQQLKKEFLKQNIEIFEKLFRHGEINNFPELYKFFFMTPELRKLRLPLPKIYSNQTYEFHKNDVYEGKHFVSRFIPTFDHDYFKIKVTDKKYHEPLFGELEHLPINIREVIFCFYEMCQSLKSRYNPRTKTEFYCRQRHGDLRSFHKYPDQLYFIVAYSDDEFEYYLVGDLEVPCEYNPEPGELYSGIFNDVNTADVHIHFDCLPSKTEMCRLTGISELFKKMENLCPEFKKQLQKKISNIQQTSLAYLRALADYSNLVILPIEYSKFRLSNEYNNVINRFGNCNVFVITTLENYDLLGEVTDDDEKPKRKFFPTDLSSLLTSIEFSIPLQKTFYHELKNLEKRVDELENAFNKNMHIMQQQIHQLQCHAVKTDLQISALAIHLMRIEWEKISLNQEAFATLEEQRTSIDCSPTAVNSELIISHLSCEQNKLIDLNLASKETIQDIDRITNSGLTNFEDFRLEFIKKKAEIEEFIQKIDTSKYIFVYTTADDLYENALAYTCTLES